MKRTLFALAAVAVVGCSTKKLVRPTTSEPFEKNDALVARGQYLVDSVGACGTCHTGRESGNLLDGESTDLYLAGGMKMKHPMLKGGAIFFPNLTPDPETGLGKWTDDEIARAIRDGIDKDGKLMFPMMPFGQFRHVSDDDVKAIIAYLRTIPPVKSAPRERTLDEVGGMMGFVLKRGIAHKEPVTKPVPNPDKSDKVAYGRYLARIGACADCHAGTKRGPVDEGHPKYMAGGEPDDLTAFGVGVVYMRNLTPDAETGIGKYTKEDFIKALRSGRRLDGKKMAPPMSLFIPHWSTMTDEDLDALATYFYSLKPVKNAVPERKLLPAFEKTLDAPSS